MKLATLVYVKDSTKNKTLMLHRVKKDNDFHEGKWNGLGGKFELGESPEDCVIREVKEESGLTVLSMKLKGFITFPDFDGVDDWYVFVYIVNSYSGELIDSSEGLLEWIDDNNLPNLNLWDGDKIFMDWLNEERFFSAKFVYNNKEYKSHVVNFY